MAGYRKETGFILREAIGSGFRVEAEISRLVCMNMTMPTNTLERPAAPANGIHRKRSARVAAGEPKPIIRYFYYAFIFSIPFESVDVGIARCWYYTQIDRCPAHRANGAATPFMLEDASQGVLVVCGLSLLVFGMGSFFILSGSELSKDIILRFLTLFQLLVLFWVSYNILQYKPVVRGALLTLIASCTIVGGLIAAGLSTEEACPGHCG